MKENRYSIKSYGRIMRLDILAYSNLLYLLAVKLQLVIDIWCPPHTSTSLSGDSRKALPKPLHLRMLVNTQ